jgi:DNA-binding HxlR family transcriptional regulator
LKPRFGQRKNDRRELPRQITRRHSRILSQSLRAMENRNPAKRRVATGNERLHIKRKMKKNMFKLSFI